jgi:hypothetical protein
MLGRLEAGTQLEFKPVGRAFDRAPFPNFRTMKMSIWYVIDSFLTFYSARSVDEHLSCPYPNRSAGCTFVTFLAMRGVTVPVQQNLRPRGRLGSLVGLQYLE